jgi:hypothetical protein
MEAALQEVQVTVRNLGPGVRSVINSSKRHVTLASGDSRKVKVHPFTAHLLIKDASSPRPKFEVDISADDRVAMEQAVEEARYVKPKLAMGNAVDQGKPTEQRRPAVDKRFITDPKTVQEPGDKEKKGTDRKSERKAARRSSRKARPRRRPRQDDEED